jgi:hypothetical protein
MEEISGSSTHAKTSLDYLTDHAFYLADLPGYHCQQSLYGWLIPDLTNILSIQRLRRRSTVEF